MDAQAAWKLDPIDLPAGTRVGNWRIIGRLGWGGYGAVYLVRGEHGLRRQAALKLALRPGTVSLRLEREVELLSRVKHSNVARLIDAGHWLVPGARERLPFLVMEYVPGPCLYALLSLRDVQVREALDLFKQSALALHAVHGAGALHRDVKGENLLVREDGRLVLVDLGVGDYEGAASLTGTQLPPGTSLYRSPEALRFQREHLGDFELRYEFRHADDLYALGVTWYRAFTLSFPFGAERPEDSYRALLEGRAPEAPAALNPRVPQEVSELLSRLVSPRPEERPAGAREVTEAVDALLRRGGPGLAEPLFVQGEAATPHSRATEASTPSPPAREKVPRLKRPGALLLVAVLMAALTVGRATCLGLPFESNHPTQEHPSMRESKTPASSSPASQVQPSTPDMAFMKSLAAAVCLVTAGCVGVPVNPTWPQDCPQEALRAMSIRGFGPGKWGHLTLDINRPLTAYSPYADFRAGPIVSFIEEGDSADSMLPVGTKLYGQMWTGGERIQVYWTRAEMPGGVEMPVCMLLGADERGGWFWKEPGTEPGTFKITRQVPVMVTRRFERPE
ncbi:protein kinase domain-containing protein [Archangium gephyra]|uniref:protein kinase domain-containing protein n=1 Tax=Archangium gephyra TaxID=48 RepID=UPI003B7A006A